MSSIADQERFGTPSQPDLFGRLLVALTESTVEKIAGRGKFVAGFGNNFEDGILPAGPRNSHNGGDYRHRRLAYWPAASDERKIGAHGVRVRAEGGGLLSQVLTSPAIPESLDQAHEADSA